MNHPLLNNTLGEIISLIDEDPCVIGQLRGLLPPDLFKAIAPTRAGPPPGCPPIPEITAIQTAVFDNWPTGRRANGQPNRYGVSVEVWTKPNPRVRSASFDFKCRMALLDAKALDGFIRNLSKPNRVYPVDPTYLADLADIQSNLSSNDFVGLLNTRIADDIQGHERGTCYHRAQMLWVSISGHEIKHAQLINGDESVVLAPFSSRSCNGGHLGSMIVGQSRHDLCGSLTEWRTNQP